MKRTFRKDLALLLIRAEHVIHLMVSLMLIIAGSSVFYYSFKIFNEISNITIFMLINNALLLLIIKEVLWTVIKFFRGQDFSLNSFLFIGVISSIRSMLLIEVQKSIEKTQHLELALELGINAITIFILMLSYYLFNKAKLFKLKNYNK